MWQYCRNELPVDNIEVTDFTEANVTDSFKLTGQTSDNDTKNVEIMVPVKYVSNFWRTLEMRLINCEIALDLNWSGSCGIVASNAVVQTTAFSITDTKLCVRVVTL